MVRGLSENDIREANGLWKMLGDMYEADPEREAEFLNHVVKGEQRQAEKLLKKNRHLALASRTVTDPANRTFNNITGFQYAVWALDWHMWSMIQKYFEEVRSFKLSMMILKNP